MDKQPADYPQGLALLRSPSNHYFAEYDCNMHVTGDPRNAYTYE
jgi:hypothetical protein